MTNKKKVAIHQSQFLPWMPYFKKIYLCDEFVFLDHVQFQKNGIQNRNIIRNRESGFWLTIPVNNKLNESISEKKIINSYAVLEKNWKSISQNYSKAINWNKYKGKLEEFFFKEYVYLSDLNYDLLLFFLDVMEIKTPILKSSSLNLQSSKNELILEICKKTNADIYLSGQGGKEYLKETDFIKQNIELSYLDLKSPEYKQIYEPFISNLSALDFIMNVSEVEIENYLKN